MGSGGSRKWKPPGVPKPCGWRASRGSARHASRSDNTPRSVREGLGGGWSRERALGRGWLEAGCWAQVTASHLSVPALGPPSSPHPQKSMSQPGPSSSFCIFSWPLAELSRRFWSNSLAPPKESKDVNNSLVLFVLSGYREPSPQSHKNCDWVRIPVFTPGLRFLGGSRGSLKLRSVVTLCLQEALLLRQFYRVKGSDGVRAQYGKVNN